MKVKLSPSLLGNTYCFVKFFLQMKLTKIRCRNQLTDEHLTSQLRAATTSVKADIDKLCKTLIFKCPTKIICHDKMSNSIACVCL